ncbi:MAG: hypothetical protein JJT77_06025 [Crocinitomicaceae bacterium]|nr:hypothetical protein [Crocinitomicaceae bacterium]
MENRKIVINRAKVSSAEIEKRRNFNRVLEAVNAAPSPIPTTDFWKSIGFWGQTGLASIAAIALLKLNGVNENQNLAYDENITLSKSISIEELPQDTPCIQPKISGVDLPFETFNLIGNNGHQITLSDGSSILIPAGALEIGQEDNFTLRARTFPDKSSAFIAGIPMDHDGGAFESGGMIELRAERNGEIIAIRSENPIQVALSLTKPSDGFQFYQLNDLSGEWQSYPATFTDRSNDKNISENANNEAAQKLLSTNKQIQSEIQSIQQEISQNPLPKKEAYQLPIDKDRIFKIEYDAYEFPELAALGKNVEFEALPNQPQYNAMFEQSWSYFDLKEQGGSFSVVFGDNQKKMTLKVRPVLKGEALVAALSAYTTAKQEVEQKHRRWQEKQKELELAHAANEERIATLKATQKNHNIMLDIRTDAQKEQDAYLQNLKLQHSKSIINQQRSANFQTSNWGVFNVDRPIAYPTPFDAQTIYALKHAVPGEKIKEVYVFDLEKDVRYAFGSGSRGIADVGVFNNESVLLVLLESGDIAYKQLSGIKDISNNPSLQLTPVKAHAFDIQLLQSLLHEGRVVA